MSTNTAWMQNNLNKIGGKTLRQLCLPGTHDAGMGTFSSGTPFASKCNTVTQTSLVLGQLQFGSRYFDIRPVVSAGKYYTGHYTEIDVLGLGLKSWQGANGQSIKSIIDDANEYTKDHAELIIFHLSHDLDTDVGNDKYSPLTQRQWDGLLSMMKEEINYLKVLSADDLTCLTVNDYISNGESAIIVIVEPSDDNINISYFSDAGFYPIGKFPVYNVYSDTNDLEKMAADQLEKMREQKTSPDDTLFLLSWTLTQQEKQVITCAAGLENSIIDLADEANAILFDKLLPACSDNCFPNIVYIDALSETTDVVSLVMKINSGLTKDNIPNVENRPYPLVFVHGRNADSGVWRALKDYLIAHGYTENILFGWDYDSSQSANEVLSGQFKNYVDDVLSNTGAEKVDIVAHSLGSLLTRWFIKFDGGKDSVRQWISLAGPNHGTTLGWLCALLNQGCKDMTPGSYVITNLNQGSETVSPTQFTTIWSAGDEQISPPTSTVLSGANNIQVSKMKHNELLISEEVFEHILNSLAQNYEHPP